nr:MAG TPA: hypothetical protein [Caudoviricetes sp.]
MPAFRDKLLRLRPDRSISASNFSKNVMASPTFLRIG